MRVSNARFAWARASLYLPSLYKHSDAKYQTFASSPGDRGTGWACLAFSIRARASVNFSSSIRDSTNSVPFTEEDLICFDLVSISLTFGRRISLICRHT